MMGSVSLLLIGSVCSVGIGICFLLRNNIYLFKAGVITSFAIVFIIKVVKGNDLRETVVNY